VRLRVVLRCGTALRVSTEIRLAAPRSLEEEEEEEEEEQAGESIL
jgi:hypothetical protein